MEAYIIFRARLPSGRSRRRSTPRRHQNTCKGVTRRFLPDKTNRRAFKNLGGGGISDVRYYIIAHKSVVFCRYPRTHQPKHTIQQCTAIACSSTALSLTCSLSRQNHTNRPNNLLMDRYTDSFKMPESKPP